MNKLRPREIEQIAKCDVLVPGGFNSVELKGKSPLNRFREPFQFAAVHTHRQDWRIRSGIEIHDPVLRVKTQGSFLWKTKCAGNAVQKIA